MHKGMHKGTQRVLQWQAEKKIGAISPEISFKLTHASEEQLIQWSERILFAETLEEIFKD